MLKRRTKKKSWSLVLRSSVTLFLYSVLSDQEKVKQTHNTNVRRSVGNLLLRLLFLMGDKECQEWNLCAIILACMALYSIYLYLYIHRCEKGVYGCNGSISGVSLCMRVVHIETRKKKRLDYPRWYSLIVSRVFLFFFLGLILLVFSFVNHQGIFSLGFVRRALLVEYNVSVDWSGTQ